MTAVVATELPRILSRVPIDALAAATKRCRATVRNWLEARTAPSAVDLVSIFSEFPDLIREVAELSGHRVVTEAQLDAAREALKLLGE
jgi:hypothetical protein